MKGSALDRKHHPRRSRGFTLVELMIGLTLGLLLMAGACSMAGLQLGEHHRLMLELQVQQELRATAELLLRDLRRASFWDRAQDGIWQEPSDTPVRNPYAAILVEDGGRRVSYSFAREGSPPGGASVRETSGFRLSDGRIDQLIAGRYQPLTDPALLRVRQVEVSVASQAHALGEVCEADCAGLPSAASPPTVGSTGGSPVGCPPVLSTRLVTVTVEAEAVHDARATHRLELVSRSHNPVLTGDCP